MLTLKKKKLFLDSSEPVDNSNENKLYVPEGKQAIQHSLDDPSKKFN